MRKLFDNPDSTKTGYYQSILEEAGIPTFFRDTGAQLGLSEIALPAELWVVNDEDYERAIDVLEPYVQPESDPAKLTNWYCPSCGVEVEGNFGECWKCGGMRPAAAASGGDVGI